MTRRVSRRIARTACVGLGCVAALGALCACASAPQTVLDQRELRDVGIDFNIFAGQIASQFPRGELIGVLPIVLYQQPNSSPEVAEICISLAEEVTRIIDLEPRLTGRLVGPNDLFRGYLPTRAEAHTFHTLSGVRDEGIWLGVDVLVFGELRRTITPSRPDQYALQLDAVPVRSGSDTAIEPIRAASTFDSSKLAGRVAELCRSSAWIVTERPEWEAQLDGADSTEALIDLLAQRWNQRRPTPVERDERWLVLPVEDPVQHDLEQLISVRSAIAQRSMENALGSAEAVAPITVCGTPCPGLVDARDELDRELERRWTDERLGGLE